MPSTDFHPDLRRVAHIAPPGLIGPRSLRLIRALSGSQRSKSHDGVEVPIPALQVGVRLHRPIDVSQKPTPALLWAHGGGYVMGSAQQDDALCRLLHSGSWASRSRRWSTGWRPSIPTRRRWRTAVLALTWLAGLPAVDPARVAIGGASAGGGLAAALALLARDRGEVTPTLQLLAYPMLVDRSGSGAEKSPNHRLWSPGANRLRLGVVPRYCRPAGR